MVAVSKVKKIFIDEETLENNPSIFKEIVGIKSLAGRNKSKDDKCKDNHNCNEEAS